MANPHLDLLLQLMGGAKSRLGARPSPELSEYVTRRTDPALAQNPLPGVNPPLPGPGSNPPISRDPFFDELMTSEYVGDPRRQFDELQPDEQPTLGGAEWANQRQTLILDMMRAVGIEPRGSYDRYYSQLKSVDDAFIKRIAQKLELNENMNISPDALRSLIATEFEAFGHTPP